MRGFVVLGRLTLMVVLLEPLRLVERLLSVCLGFEEAVARLVFLVPVVRLVGRYADSAAT